MSWSTAELRVSSAPLNRLKPSSKIFLLTVPRRCFLCGSFYVISVLFCYAFMHVCLLMPCGHLLGKVWPLGSRLWCVIVTLSLSHWYPGSGVVLDCIYSWSLPSCSKWDIFWVAITPKLWLRNQKKTHIWLRTLIQGHQSSSFIAYTHVPVGLNFPFPYFESKI